MGMEKKSAFAEVTREKNIKATCGMLNKPVPLRLMVLVMRLRQKIAPYSYIDCLNGQQTSRVRHQIIQNKL